MTDVTRALADFVALCERMNLSYAVMGGLAVRLYAIPRPTQDVDFTVAIDRPRLGELFAAARQLGYTVPEAYAQGWVDQVAGMPLVRFQMFLDGRAVDVDFFLAESAFQRQLLGRRVRHPANGFDAWFVTPEDLVLLKLIAHRPRDMADVADILFVQGTLDTDYLCQWADLLGVRQELDRSLEEAGAA